MTKNLQQWTDLASLLHVISDQVLSNRKRSLFEALHSVFLPKKLHEPKSLLRLCRMNTGSRAPRISTCGFKLWYARESEEYFEIPNQTPRRVLNSFPEHKNPHAGTCTAPNFQVELLTKKNNSGFGTFATYFFEALCSAIWSLQSLKMLRNYILKISPLKIVHCNSKFNARSLEKLIYSWFR